MEQAPYSWLTKQSITRKRKEIDMQQWPQLQQLKRATFCSTWFLSRAPFVQNIVRRYPPWELYVDVRDNLPVRVVGITHIHKHTHTHTTGIAEYATTTEHGASCAKHGPFCYTHRSGRKALVQLRAMKLDASGKLHLIKGGVCPADLIRVDEWDECQEAAIANAVPGIQQAFTQAVGFFRT